MKYMGSKRAMLRNGLGSLLNEQITGRKYDRFIDLFSGSASVAWFIAENFPVEVLATDLQLYSRELANSILVRTRTISSEKIWRDWYKRAKPIFREINPIASNALTENEVWAARAWAEWFPEGSLVRAYAGHYFSPTQAAWIQALRVSLPAHDPDRAVCLGSLIVASSRAAAAPGHTAQPFQPTVTARKFIEESWSKDVTELVRASLDNLCSRHALTKGAAEQVDANKFAQGLSRGDLAFVDPPYSGVHYSRFYHVLESIAKGDAQAVSGVGRYPPADQRPRSLYSTKTTSQFAVKELLTELATRGVDVVFTFPDHECSNGLSGKEIQNICAELFYVETRAVHSIFSTLGGGSDGEGSRRARQKASELILVLRSRA